MGLIITSDTITSGPVGAPAEPPMSTTAKVSPLTRRAPAARRRCPLHGVLIGCRAVWAVLNSSSSSRPSDVDAAWWLRSMARTRRRSLCCMSHLSNVWFKVTDLQVTHGRVQGHHGERRRVPRLRGRHRRQLHGSRPPEGRGGDRRPGGALHPRPDQRLHPRPRRAVGDATFRDRAGRDRHLLLRQLRSRDHGGRGQARQAGHGARTSSCSRARSTAAPTWRWR